MDQVRSLMVLSENWTLRPELSISDVVDLAVAAEKAGVDGIMLSDHIVLGPSANADGEPENLRDYAAPGNQDPVTPWPSPLVLLSAIAARTTTLRLVFGAIIAPLRHPLNTAKDLGTLDLLSKGRLIVIPTVSWHEEEFRALGVDFSKRGAILDEQLEIWKLAWSQDPVTFKGEHYAFDEVFVEPKAYRPAGPTLWFGGSSVHPALIRRMVEFGSGLNPFGAPTDSELAQLSSALMQAGRSMGEIEMVGGIRGRFNSAHDLADLDAAMDDSIEQLRQGYRTMCFKPSMFTDSVSEVPEICRRVTAGLNERLARLS
jgi:probable F420-dependent oxidoreductase